MDRMKDLLDSKGKAKVDDVQTVLKKPSSANRKHDADDESGDDRSGQPRDTQKARPELV